MCFIRCGKRAHFAAGIRAYIVCPIPAGQPGHFFLPIFNSIEVGMLYSISYNKGHYSTIHPNFCAISLVSFRVRWKFAGVIPPANFYVLRVKNIGLRWSPNMKKRFFSFTVVFAGKVCQVMRLYFSLLTFFQKCNFYLENDSATTGHIS